MENKTLGLLSPYVDDQRDYTDKYNTDISPQQEQAFQVQALLAKRLGDLYDYDLRGLFSQQGGHGLLGSIAMNGHGTDRYKKPNHPTFSDQSIYNGVGGHQGGHWGGNDNRGYYFAPGSSNMYSPQELQQYFSDIEPDVTLWDFRNK